MRRIATWVGLGIALAIGTPAGAAGDERVLDRFVVGDDVLTVSVMSGDRGTRLVVRTESTEARRLHEVLSLQAFPVADLFPGAEIVAGKAAPRSKGDVVVALVVRRGGAYSHHWMTTTGGKDGSWFVSDPIWSGPGEPFRVVEVRNPEGDSIEITFRRGRPDPTASSPAFEDLVYSRSGTTERLYSLRPMTLESSRKPAATPTGPTPGPTFEPPTPTSLLAVVSFAQDGTLSFAAPGTAEPKALGKVERPAHPTWAYRALYDALHAAADAPGRREPDGTSALRLVLRAHPATWWGWIVHAWEHADLERTRIRRFRLDDGAGAIDLDLPLGAANDHAGSLLPIRLVREAVEGQPGPTTVRVGSLPSGEEIPLEPGAGRAAAVAAMVERIRARLTPGVEGVDVRIPDPPFPPRYVSCGDLLDVVRAARSAGVRRIRLPGLPGRATLR